MGNFSINIYLQKITQIRSPVYNIFQVTWISRLSHFRNIHSDNVVEHALLMSYTYYYVISQVILVDEKYFRYYHNFENTLSIFLNFIFISLF